MSRRMVAYATAGLLALGGVAACTDRHEAGAGASGAKVGVILPDTASAQRWVTDDPKQLKAAFDAAGVAVDIQNAQGRADAFAAIADRMIAGGAKVLMIVSLDPVSGQAVLDKARAAGVKTIDYDRLTLNGGADYHVSFDSVEVGRLQGQGLLDCLRGRGGQPRIAYLNGAPTDHNATLLRTGYDSVLQPKYDDGTYLKGPEQSVRRWNNDEARVIFDQMLADTHDDIDGVLAANDGLADAAITILKRERRNGGIPVTGQDAEVQGLRNILTGDQCMTVYKPLKKEAEAAAKLAVALVKGGTARTNSRIKDPQSGGYVPAVLLRPTAIFRKDVGDVVADGFVDRKALCAGAFARLCRRNGIA